MTLHTFAGAAGARRTALTLVLGATLAACGGSKDADDSAAPTRLLATTVASGAAVNGPARIMEKLGRGIIAVRTNNTAAYISWRLLALDPDNVAFNVYRSRNGGAAVKLNATPLTGGTNYTDTSSELASANTYWVRPVIDGVEQADSGTFTLKANNPREPIVRVPLSPAPGAGYYTAYVWVGDLDGDGEYDYVLDRIAPFTPGNNDFGTGHQYLEAYKRDGTRLWQIDMGPSSTYTYNISPGAATLSMGMYDGVTVYDLNGDGKAEVVLKVADGVKFGDGTTFTDADKEQQYIAVLDGARGTPLATRQFPADFYAQAGRYGTQLGIGYPDGVSPSIYFWGRNRNKDKSFNDVFASWSWTGSSTITQNWSLPLRWAAPWPEASHQLRIIDLDGDGKDEMMTGNFAVNSDGSLRYVLPGVGHGDRFYVGKFSKNQVGMRGYGVQQNNPSGLLEYYYDATNGSMLWTHSNAPGKLVDVGRGLVGDVDPRFPGYEAWSFSGLYNADQNVLTEPNTSLYPWPSHMIWWDGDLGSELLNEHKIEKWDPLAPKASNSLSRLVSLTSSAYGYPTLNWRNPMFFGDILGDWRTEVVLMNSTFSELVIFTTNVPSTTRLYTMAQNPAYRNHMTIKGYLQTPLPDYYLGFDMEMPARPNIRYPAVQAEQARLAGGTVVNSGNTGFKGSGFLKFPQTGGSAVFQVDGGVGGSKTLSIRYANGSPTPRTGIVRVNGVAYKTVFKITGSFNQWTTLDVPVTLAPGGANTVSLESTGQFLGNIDEVSVL